LKLPYKVAHVTIEKIARRFLRIIAWSSVSILAILILAILLIRMPYVQNKLVQKAVSFLEGKIGTEVRLTSIYVDFPKRIVLEELFLEDEETDTLLYAGKISLDTDLWSLLQNRIQLNTVQLSNAVVRLKRNEVDSAFNFNYIINAFTDTTAIDTTQTAWGFSLGRVQLSQLSFSLNDAYSGYDTDLNVGDLELTLKEFNLSESVYTVSTLEVKNTNCFFTQFKEVVDNSSEATEQADSLSSFAIDFNKIALENVTFEYTNFSLGQKLVARVGEFEIELNSFDLNKQQADVESIKLSKSFFSYQTSEPHDTTKLQESISKEELFFDLDVGWDLKLNLLALTEINFQYFDFNVPISTQGLDFNHLWVLALNISARDVEVNKNQVKANIQGLSLKEKSGFAVNSFASDLELTNTDLIIENFRLQAGASSLNLNARASFPSLATTAFNYEQATVNLEVNNSSLALSDMLFFIPSLNDSLPINLPVNTALLIDTKLKGSVADLAIESLVLQTFDSTRLSISGSVKGLPEYEQARMRLRVNNMHSTESDLLKILPDSLIPSSIQLPKWISLEGDFSGTIKSPETNSIIKSSFGDVELAGKVDLTSIESYNATFTTRKLNVGKLIKQKDVGTLDMKVLIKGKGTRMENLDAVVEATVSEVWYKTYGYKDFKLNGSFKNYFFSGNASLTDKNLDFDLTADLNYETDVPHYELTFAVKNADLKALKLTGRPLKFKATFDVNIDTKDFQSINGYAGIRKFGVYNGEALYLVDSLLFASIEQEGESSVSIRSDILTGDFKGTFSAVKLPTILKQYMNQYFSLQDTAITKFREPQKFEFDLVLKNTELLTEVLFPDLETFVPGKMQGRFNSEENTLEVEIDLAKIKYGSTGVDSIIMRLGSDNESLGYSLRLKNVTQDTLRINVLEFTGVVANDSIQTVLTILDSLSEKKYVLGATVTSIDKTFRLHLNPDQVVLHYNDWQIPSDNYFQFASNSLRAHNFILSKQKEELAVITQPMDSSLLFQFKQFELSNLTRIVSGVIPASGLLNGELKFATVRKGEFSSKLEIAKLTILEKLWGDATLSLEHAADVYNVDARIKGENLNLRATGSYNTSIQTPEFLVDVSFAPFNLALVESLSFGQLKNVTGLLEGKMKITGNANQPYIRGELTFNKAKFTITDLNSSFSLENESLSFQREGIVFNSFKIRDERNKEARVRGRILTEAYQQFEFNLGITAEDFQLQNTSSAYNELFYGVLRADILARIRGNSNEPRIDLTVGVGDESNLTYVVPQTEKNVLEQKGIVQFIDRDEKGDPFMQNLKLADTTQVIFKGINLTANIELTDKAVLNILIDPATGDQLSVQGNSTLVFDTDASGNMNLSGRYEITKGSYSFSFYKLVKREFEIEKGSSIIWSGDPLNAQMDIRAKYALETSPLDLVYNQINTTNQSEINSYNQRLPFFVYLLIKGRLLVPEISFAIDMPEDNRNAFGGAIYAKLQDINTRESDLNKQVFALLILKRFISENPFESQANSRVGNTTRVSVSRILSEQLNRLSEKVKGVQLNFDIKSYENYSGEEVQGETKVQLGITKNLFNDRLVVKLSGNLDIEGEETAESEVTDYIGDLALEYKLTPDGRFRVTGFRNSNYDMIDGELTETGAGLIYIKDYNTLRELFRSNVKAK
jgi:translocation and assembly module TamB